MLSKRACDRRFSRAQHYLTPTEPTRAAPHSNRYNSFVPAHVVLQIKCDCCVTGRGLLPLYSYSIHFQVPPTIIHPINRQSTIVHRPPSTRPGAALSLRL